MRTRLQELRKKAGYKSAKAFAAEAGIKLGTYTDYEQGRTVMSLERAWQFADILQVSLDELAGRDFPPKADGNYADPRQAELNECWQEADDAQRSIILGVAQMGAGRSGADAPSETPAVEANRRQAG